MARPYLALMAAILVIVVAYALSVQPRQPEELRVLHAGSLTPLVEDLGSIMQDRYSISVLNEPGGSIDVIRRVVDLGKKADVLMVADHRLIEGLMMPQYTSWVIVFASNEMVLAYTDGSMYSDEINGENWLEIITRPDVRVGASDPNKDPCGYRSLMVLALAYLQDKDERALELLERIGKVEIGDTISVDVSGGVPEDTGNLVFREKSVDLIALLETGVLDYAFEYRNVAVSHGLKFVELPTYVNLSDPDLDDLYGRVSVRIVGAGNRPLTLQASAITYGLTVPNTAENIEGAKKFIELLMDHKEILERNGFKPLENPLTIGELPDWLAGS